MLRIRLCSSPAVARGMLQHIHRRQSVIVKKVGEFVREETEFIRKSIGVSVLTLVGGTVIVMAVGRIGWGVYQSRTSPVYKESVSLVKEEPAVRQLLSSEPRVGWQVTRTSADVDALDVTEYRVTYGLNGGEAFVDARGFRRKGAASHDLILTDVAVIVPGAKKRVIISVDPARGSRTAVTAASEDDLKAASTFLTSRLTFAGVAVAGLLTLASLGVPLYINLTNLNHYGVYRKAVSLACSHPQVVKHFGGSPRAMWFALGKVVDNRETRSALEGNFTFYIRNGLQYGRVQVKGSMKVGPKAEDLPAMARDPEKWRVTSLMVSEGRNVLRVV